VARETIPFASVRATVASRNSQGSAGAREVSFEYSDNLTQSECGSGAHIRLLRHPSGAAGPSAARQPASELTQESEGYYVIGLASRNRSDAVGESQQRNQIGFQTHVAYSSDWSGFAPGWYIVVYGIHSNKTDAMAARTGVQARGVQAYVKHSGVKLN
jgi:hypothetical protein